MNKKLLTAFAAILLVCVLPLAAACNPKEQPQPQITYTLQSISLDTSAVQTEFYLAEDFSAKGLVVSGRFSGTDGSSKTEQIPAGSYTVDSSAFKAEVGSYQITVSATAGGITQTASYTVTMAQAAFDGLEVAPKAGKSDTIVLSTEAPKAQIDVNDFEVYEALPDGSVSATPTTGCTFKLYRGSEEIALSNGKAQVEAGIYQLWAFKPSSRVPDKTSDGFVVVYVVDNVVSLQWNSAAEGTLTSQQQGADQISSTWKFTVTYSSGATETVSAADVEFNPAIDTNTVGKDIAASATYTQVNARGEKHTTSPATVTYTITASAAEKPANVVFNVSDAAAGNISQSTVLAEGITAVANSDKNITIESNKKTIDGFSFTQRLKLNGTGSATGRSIKLEVKAGATIVVYAISGSSSADRILALHNADGDKIAEQTALGASISKLTYTVSEAGTYYLWSLGSGINLYYISIEY